MRELYWLVIKSDGRGVKCTAHHWKARQLVVNRSPWLKAMMWEMHERHRGHQHHPHHCRWACHLAQPTCATAYPHKLFAAPTVTHDIHMHPADPALPRLACRATSLPLSHVSGPGELQTYLTLSHSREWERAAWPGGPCLCWRRSWSWSCLWGI